jgi:nucleotide-binding universal stress UspA family protein
MAGKLHGILAGYDGSPGREEALTWAAREARARGAVLTVYQAWTLGYPALPTLMLLLSSPRGETASRPSPRASGARGRPWDPWSYSRCPASSATPDAPAGDPRRDNAKEKFPGTAGPWLDARFEDRCALGSGFHMMS